MNLAKARYGLVVLFWNGLKPHSYSWPWIPIHKLPPALAGGWKNDKISPDFSPILFLGSRKITKAESLICNSPERFSSGKRKDTSKRQ